MSLRSCSILTMALAGAFMSSPCTAADDAPPSDAETGTVRYRIVGLFARERIDHLRETFAEFPQFGLEEIDFDASEATFRFDPKKVFPTAKPEQVVQRFDNLVKTATRSTFGIRERSAIPREKLTRVEIPVVGLDCLACGLAAYESIAKIDGVEQATASFRDGLVVAWIDASKTDRAALEAALKLRNVTLKTP